MCLVCLGQSRVSSVPFVRPVFGQRTAKYGYVCGKSLVRDRRHSDDRPRSGHARGPLRERSQAGGRSDVHFRIATTRPPAQVLARKAAYPAGMPSRQPPPSRLRCGYGRTPQFHASNVGHSLETSHPAFIVGLFVWLSLRFSMFLVPSPPTDAILPSKPLRGLRGALTDPAWRMIARFAHACLSTSPSTSKWWHAREKQVKNGVWTGAIRSSCQSRDVFPAGRWPRMRHGAVSRHLGLFA